MAEGAGSAKARWLQWGFPFQGWLGGLGPEQRGGKELRGDEGRGQKMALQGLGNLGQGGFKRGERWTYMYLETPLLAARRPGNGQRMTFRQEIR